MAEAVSGGAGNRGHRVGNVGHDRDAGSRTTGKRTRGSDEDHSDTPVAKQPRGGLYSRVSGLVGRAVGLLTPGRGAKARANGEASSSSSDDDSDKVEDNSDLEFGNEERVRTVSENDFLHRSGPQGDYVAATQPIENSRSAGSSLIDANDQDDENYASDLGQVSYREHVDPVARIARRQDAPVRPLPHLGLDAVQSQRDSGAPGEDGTGSDNFGMSTFRVGYARSNREVQKKSSQRRNDRKLLTRMQGSVDGSEHGPTSDVRDPINGEHQASTDSPISSLRAPHIVRARSHNGHAMIGSEGEEQPFTSTEVRDLIHALRFRRGLPPAASMYVLSRLESRPAALMRRAILREYRNASAGISGTAEPRGRAVASHASLLDAHRRNGPALVAPIARRRLPPARTDLAVPSSYRRSVDGPERRGDVGVEFLRNEMPPPPARGRDPDGLLTPDRGGRIHGRDRRERSFALSTPSGDRIWQRAATSSQGTPWASTSRQHGQRPASRTVMMGETQEGARRTITSGDEPHTPAQMARQIISVLDDVSQPMPPPQLAPAPTSPPRDVRSAVGKDEDLDTLPTKVLSVPHPAGTKGSRKDSDVENKVRVRSARLAQPRWAPTKTARVPSEERSQDYDAKMDEEVSATRDGGIEEVVATGTSPNAEDDGNAETTKLDDSNRAESRRDNTNEEEPAGPQVKDRNVGAGREAEAEGRSVKESECSAEKADESRGAQECPAAADASSRSEHDALEQEDRRPDRDDREPGHIKSVGRDGSVTRSDEDRHDQNDAPETPATSGVGEKRRWQDTAAEDDAIEERKRLEDRRRGRRARSPYVLGGGRINPNAGLPSSVRPGEAVMRKRDYADEDEDSKDTVSRETRVTFADDVIKTPSKGWTCRGCYVRNYVMDAKECDMCRRARNFGTAQFRNPPAVLPGGRTLYTVRAGLEAAGLTSPGRLSSTPSSKPDLTVTLSTEAGNGAKQTASPSVGTSSPASGAADGVMDAPVDSRLAPGQGLKMGAASSSQIQKPSAFGVSISKAAGTSTAPAVSSAASPAPSLGASFTFGGTDSSTPGPSSTAFSFIGASGALEAAASGGPSTAPAPTTPGPSISPAAGAVGVGDKGSSPNAPGGQTDAASGNQVPSFSFGAAAPKASDSGGNKATASTTTTSLFTTVSTAAVTAPTTGATPAFTFGASVTPSAGRKAADTTAAAPEATQSSTAPSAPAPAAPSFTFGSSATKSPTETAPAPGPTAAFTFGGATASNVPVPAPSTSTTPASALSFTFGSGVAKDGNVGGKSTDSAGTTSASTPSAAAPLFSFGAAPAVAPGTASAPSVGGLSAPLVSKFGGFGAGSSGAEASIATDAGKRSPSPAGFGLNAPRQSAPNTSGASFGGKGFGVPTSGQAMGGFGTALPSTAAPSQSSTAFTFGGNVAQQQNRQATVSAPTPAAGAAFTFGQSQQQQQPLAGTMGGNVIFGASAAPAPAAPGTGAAFTFGGGNSGAILGQNPTGGGFGVPSPVGQFGAAAGSQPSVPTGGFGASGGFGVGGPGAAVPATGGFNLGAGSTNKSGRRMVKGVRRQKARR